ncbi:MAG: MFS transporter [Acidimicrobiia bacterium]
MESPDEFRVRSLAVGVYLPNFLYAAGQGAVIPVIVLLALDLGASPAMAGVIVALKGLGTVLFDAPAGVLVARIAERNAMVAATVTLALAAGGIALGPGLMAYAGLVVILGAGSSVWTLARIAYAMEASPAGHRGRVMSTMGGFTRVGLTVGPFLGGAATLVLGLAGPFLVQALLGVIATATLSLSKSAIAPPDGRRHMPLTRVFIDHRRVFATAGVAMVCVEAIRASRQVIIPLWGSQIGMTAGQISVIFGISAAMEVVAFYPVGVLMDRKGRKWASVPSVSLLAVGVAAIPLTSSVLTLTLVGILIGLANGMGSGLNMTLSSDLAPPEARSEFIGLWRLVGDLGTTGGPMLVAGITAIATLGVSAVGMGLVGAAGAALLLLVVPETRAKPT